MAALEDGTYIMFNAASPKSTPPKTSDALAVDIPGAKDGWTGDLIYIWNRNDSAAQFVQIKQGDNGFTYITFMLCNMVLCPQSTYIDGGTMHIGYKNDQDEQVLWSKVVVVNRVGYEAARWNINDTGETTIYMNTVYPMYEVVPVIETGASLKVDKNNVRAGSQLIISPKAGDENNARWVFLPMGTLPKGTYQIHLKNSLTRVLMAGDKNEGSRIRVGDQGDNLDNFRVWAFTDADGGAMQVFNLESEKAMAISSPRQNSTVVQRLPTKGDEQSFVPRSAGTVQYLEPGSDRRLDEEIWTTYVMEMRHGGNTGISAVNASTKQVQSYAFVTDNTERDADYDQFFFVPTSAFDNKAPVPEDIRHYCDFTGEDMVNQYGVGTVLVKPTWIGSGEDWACRYKIQYRTASQSNTQRSGWSSWCSIEDGKIANYGWGYGTMPNCKAGLADGRWRSDFGISLSFEGNVDLYEIIYEVRRFSYSYRDWSSDPEVQPDPDKQLDIPSHGGSRSQRCIVAKAAYLTLEDLQFTGEGVSIRYGSTFARNGNSVRIYCPGLFDISQSNAPYIGRLRDSKFSRIPRDGDQVVVYWTVTTVDGITTSGSANMIVYCSFDDDTMPQIENVVVTDTQNGYLKSVKIPYNASTARLWITLDDDIYAESGITATRVVEVESDGVDTFHVPYPFNRPFSLKMYALDNGTPKVWSKSYKAVEAWTRLWNWGNDLDKNKLWFEALYNENEPPTESVNTSASTNFQAPASGSWEIGHVGHSWSQTRSIAAVEIDAWDPDALARLTAMSKCRFAWYRSPRGELMRVSIVKISETRHHDRVNYSIEMRRIRE